VRATEWEPEVVLARGVRTVVCATLPDGRSPALEYLNGLDLDDRLKMKTLFDLLAGQGRITNDEKFKRIKGTEFFEFKSFQLRFPCFWDSRGFLTLTHGVRKKQDELPKSEIDRAHRIKEQHEQVLRGERR